MTSTASQFEPKAWGRVWHRFYDDHVGESLLEFDAHRRCSLHFHRDRANHFLVLEGEVLIEQFGGIDWDYGSNKEPVAYDPERLREVKILRRGDSITIPAGVWHRFRTLTSGRMVEVYYPDRCEISAIRPKVRLDDIVRHDVGGIDEP